MSSMVSVSWINNLFSWINSSIAIFLKMTFRSLYGFRILMKLFIIRQPF
ncbi:hypothetical protein WN943_015041 [Citrus x changshan-huyou]